MNCSNCHKDIPEESKFCRFCGEKIHEEQKESLLLKKEETEGKNNISRPQEDIPQYQFGSLIKRIGAFIIDGFISFILYVILYSFLISSPKVNIEEAGKIIFLSIYIIYNSLLIWTIGSTLGKKIFRLRVTNTSYRDVSFVQAITRETVGKFLSGYIFGLGFLFALVDEHSQTWHDKLAKTYVLAVTPKGQFLSASHKPVFKRRMAVFFLAILLLISLLFLYLFIVQPHEIKGRSMEPSYRNGEYVLTDKISYWFKAPVRDDVIIFKSPENPGIDYIDRIIGIPGDKVELKEGKVYINDKELPEPYLFSDTITKSNAFIKDSQPVTLPADQYFVLGDNRDHSSDSRERGFVPRTNVIGKVIFCYWNCPQKN